ncbi:hypothetical protein DKP78_26650 [Enterococcus faecium]|nr:hypothetical protein DKP78_26650 [Enterococcus faecium]
MYIQNFIHGIQCRKLPPLSKLMIYTDTEVKKSQRKEKIREKGKTDRMPSLPSVQFNHCLDLTPYRRTQTETI